MNLAPCIFLHLSQLVSSIPTSRLRLPEFLRTAGNGTQQEIAEDELEERKDLDEIDHNEMEMGGRATCFGVAASIASRHRYGSTLKGKSHLGPILITVSILTMGYYDFGLSTSAEEIQEM